MKNIYLNKKYLLIVSILVIVIIFLTFLVVNRNNVSNSKIQNVAQTKDALFYSNSEYGFSLRFPESWKDYKAVKKDGMIEFGFNVPEQKNEFFMVFLIAKIKSSESCYEWNEKLIGEGVADDRCIVKSGDYIYSYNHAQDTVPILEKKFGDIESIIKTFSLINEARWYD